jgi:hypothetical protein
MIFPLEAVEERIRLRESGEGKFGRAVLTVAVFLAVGVIVAALALFVGLTVRRHFVGMPSNQRGTPPQESVGGNAG